MTTHDTAALVRAADAWLGATPGGPTADLVRQLRDALGGAARVPDEAGLAAIRARLAGRETGRISYLDSGVDYVSDVRALLAAVNQRDHLLADLLAQDGAALVAEGRAQARRQALALLKGLLADYRRERDAAPQLGEERYWSGAGRAALDALGLLDRRGPAPDPLPPEAARAEADRLRAENAELRRRLEEYERPDCG